MNVKQYIKECVQEEMMRNAVRSIVSEELHRMWRNGELNESLFEKDDDKEKIDNEKGDEAEADTARAQLNTLLKNPAIKKSQIAYKMMPGVAKDSARHILQDKLSGDDPMSAKEANIAIDFIHNSGLD